MATGQAVARAKDDQDTVRHAMVAGGADLRAAAGKALAGGPAAVRTFIAKTMPKFQEDDDRLLLTQRAYAGGDLLKERAGTALRGSAEDVRRFLVTGWLPLHHIDDRMLMDQILAAGGPEVRAAAQAALNADTEVTTREFLDRGQYQARAKDTVNAALKGAGVPTSGPVAPAAGPKLVGAPLLAAAAPPVAGVGPTPRAAVAPTRDDRAQVREFLVTGGPAVTSSH